MQAKDIMTANVISVSADTPIHEIVGLLLKYRISAVPVIDSARRVLGIVSEGDLLRGEGTSRTRAQRPWWLEAVFVGQTVAEMEQQLILDTLQHCLGNRTHAANILGISIRTLRNKLNEYADVGVPIPPPGTGEYQRAASIG